MTIRHTPTSDQPSIIRSKLGALLDQLGNLTLASCTLRPVSFAIGWGLAWLMRASSPSLFGIAAAVVLILLGFTGGNGGKTDDDPDKRGNCFMDSDYDEPAPPMDEFDHYNDGVLRDDRYGSDC